MCAAYATRTALGLTVLIVDPYQCTVLIAQQPRTEAVATATPTTARVLAILERETMAVHHRAAASCISIRMENLALEIVILRQTLRVQIEQITAAAIARRKIIVQILTMEIV